MITFNEARAQIFADCVDTLLKDRDLVLDALGNDPECLHAVDCLAVALSQVGGNLNKIDTAEFGRRMVEGIIRYAESSIDADEIDLAAREMVKGIAEDFQNEAWKSVT